MKATFFICLLVLLFGDIASCVKNGIDSLVVDHGNEETFQYPVKICNRELNPGPCCTGSIIGSRTILTAAHCIAQTGVYDIWTTHPQTTAGGNTFEFRLRKATNITVEHRIAHPEYDENNVVRTITYDVGLLITNATFQDNQIARLEDRDVALEFGNPNMYFLAGFGFAGSECHSWPSTLHLAAVSLGMQRGEPGITPVYSRTFNIINNVRKVAGCPADSGSAVVSRRAGTAHVVGVMSQSSYADVLLQAFIEPIFEHRQWIRQNGVGVPAGEDAGEDVGEDAGRRDEL